MVILKAPEGDRFLILKKIYYISEEWAGTTVHNGKIFLLINAAAVEDVR